MPTRVIRIKKGNPATDELELTNHGNNEAAAGDTVNWIIDNNSGVSSITSITEKKASINIFSTFPHQQGNIWTGDVSRSANSGQVFKYDIHWRDLQNNPHTYDPKITVAPSLVRDGSDRLLLTAVVAAAVGAIVGILAFTFLSSKKRLY